MGGGQEQALPEEYNRYVLQLPLVVDPLCIRRVKWFRQQALRYCKHGPLAVPLLATPIGDFDPPFSTQRGSQVFRPDGSLDYLNAPPLLKALADDLVLLGAEPVARDLRWLRALAVLPAADITRFRTMSLAAVTRPVSRAVGRAALFPPPLPVPTRLAPSPTARDAPPGDGLLLISFGNGTGSERYCLEALGRHTVREHVIVSSSRNQARVGKRAWPGAILIGSIRNFRTSNIRGLLARFAGVARVVIVNTIPAPKLNSDRTASKRLVGEPSKESHAQLSTCGAFQELWGAEKVHTFWVLPYPVSDHLRAVLHDRISSVDHAASGPRTWWGPSVATRQTWWTPEPRRDAPALPIRVVPPIRKHDLASVLVSPGAGSAREVPTELAFLTPPSRRVYVSTLRWPVFFYTIGNLVRDDRIPRGGGRRSSQVDLSTDCVPVRLPYVQEWETSWECPPDFTHGLGHVGRGGGLARDRMAMLIALPFGPALSYFLWQQSELASADSVDQCWEFVSERWEIHREWGVALDKLPAAVQ